MKASVLSLAAAPALALAQQTTHDVDVGNGGLIFSPDSITAAQGDVINFHFYNPGSHSVAQSTYMSPCVQSGDDAIFSGYISGPNGESPMVFQVTVNSTDPLWLYCATGRHCQAGMAMVVNPPAQGMDLTTYKNNAKNTESSAPEDAQGGVFLNAAPGSTTTSSGVPASSTSSGAPGSSSSSSSEAPGSSSSGAPASTSSGAAAPSGGAGGAAGSPTSSTSPQETTGAASNLQVKGAAGAAALGLLGAMMV